MFVQKIREAIRYAQLLESVETALQKIEELHTREVDSNMQNIVRALNAYRVAFGDDSSQEKEQGKFMACDIVQLHSLMTGPYNGQYGTLGNYSEEKERWQVKLEKQDNVIFVKTANLTFIREPRIKSLPGSLEVKSVLARLGELWKKQDAKGVLDMEKEVM